MVTFIDWVLVFLLSLLEGSIVESAIHQEGKMPFDLAYQQDDCNGNLFGDEARQTRIEGTIPANLAVNDGDRFLFVSKDQRSLTHGLHKYPAKFFPELPRWIIERYTNEAGMVLDPFCGSGTTNLEALLLGRNSMGVDVDEFAKMVARTKNNATG